MTINIFNSFFYIFQNWDHMSYTFMDENRPRDVSTDVAFALSMKILNIEDDIEKTIKSKKLSN